MRTLKNLSPPHVLVLLMLVLVPTGVLAQEAEESEQEAWQPTSESVGRYDWMQMSSGEWFRGRVVIMYEDELEFDSLELDEIFVDWEDVRQLRSARELTIGMARRRQVVGRVVLLDGVLTVTGEDGDTEVRQRDVLSITAGAPSERNFWTAKLFFGLTARAGNSDTFDYNGHAVVRRRTVTDRIKLEYMGNRSASGEVELSDSDRVDVAWNRVITRRFFVIPLFAEYFRDPFQNLRHRFTVGAGAGYVLIDTGAVDWDVFAGPAYQSIGYVDVAEESPGDNGTPAFVFGTGAEWEITGWLDFEGSHSFQLVDKEAGSYNHHLVVSLEAEITRLLDFDVTGVWDRVQRPRSSSDGTTPLKDDWRLAVGLTFDF